MSVPLTQQKVAAMQVVLTALYNATDPEGRPISEIFQDMPDRDEVPDYYDVIKRPMALNVIRDNIQAARYTDLNDFVRDCAQIFHNAKTYNRSDSVIYEDASLLEIFLVQKLTEMKERGAFPEVQVPALGPLPPPSTGGDTDEDASDADPSDDDDEDLDLDDEGAPRKKRKTSAKIGRPRKVVTDEEGNPIERPDMADLKRKRGRPPKVDTPNDARIKNILKGLRREKIMGRQIFAPFEKLPDPKMFPDYYEAIKNPIATEGIKRKAKAKAYKDLSSFLEDMDLMFNNAKRYNMPGSELFNDACYLQEVAHRLAQQEISRDDTELVLENAMAATPARSSKLQRIPLDKIYYKDDVFQVGDWVHLKNPNDAEKPIPAQIFRTWQSPDGSQWINVCWYYRPEQTIHRADRTFYENEVFKTGQYRDHDINDVIERIFIMFVTKYVRGRPRDIGDVKIYVCESRYNEENQEANKIKSWKSCVPDEVRGKEYDMYHFDRVRVLTKVPSPLLHWLPPDAKEGDPPTELIRGSEDGPPIRGSIIPCPPPDPSQLVKQTEPTPPPPDTSAPPPVTSSHITTLPPKVTTFQPPEPQFTMPQLPPRLPPPPPPVYAQPPVPPVAFTMPPPPVMPDGVARVNALPDATVETVQRDPLGRVLWFPVPPNDNVKPVLETGVKGHSLAYLAKRRDIMKAKKEKLAKARQGAALTKTAKSDVDQDQSISKEYQEAARELLAQGLVQVTKHITA
ncbi:Bromodomain-containing protein [Saitoella complicata NRRL Y-17804]|nr:Bromodomain-containing protein [Saitoella complicata NRRL Y-17804]ODQ56384.1 Bromodomain-containing protein [Saitoella complicata NRRL Y-17804]